MSFVKNFQSAFTNNIVPDRRGIRSISINILLLRCTYTFLYICIIKKINDQLEISEIEAGENVFLFDNSLNNHGTNIFNISTQLNLKSDLKINN